MKKLFLTLFSAICLAGYLSAQICTPNDTVTILVFPPPYNPATSPNGGITKVACKGMAFEYLFTVNVPTEFSNPALPVPLPLDSAVMQQTGAVTNLPAGLNYACNPGTCKFLPQTKGCALLYGTVANNVASGSYNLSLEFTAHVKLFGSAVPFPYVYPSQDTASTQDRYTLLVRNSNDALCTSGLFDAPIQAGNVRISPNPVSQTAYVLADMERGGQYRIQVINSFGSLVMDNQQQFHRGDNVLEIPVNALAAGIYRLLISDGNRQISQNFVVAH